MKKLTNKLKTLSTGQLCEAFAETNKREGPEIPTLRGAIMDELEARDAVAFDNWLEANNDSPALFFA